jgi:hypothetical protein
VATSRAPQRRLFYSHESVPRNGTPSRPVAGFPLQPIAESVVNEVLEIQPSPVMRT